MRNPVLQSAYYFNNDYGCAESVLMAIAEYKGIESDLIPRIATGFCGGMARTNGMCGAVTGAVLALNIMLGRNNADESQEKNYKAIQIFLDRFKKKFGDVNCTTLTGCDLSTEAGRTKFDKKGQHKICTQFVEVATRIVLDII